jgi:hypothetical protein
LPGSAWREWSEDQPDGQRSDLLLAASDAYGHLADELVAEYDRRLAAGVAADVLDWARWAAAGIVLHCGKRTDSVGDRLLALPITVLWAH